MTKKITKYTKDEDGNTPISDWISSLWMHTGNNRLYQVVDFVWCCDTDLWHVMYREWVSRNQTAYTRSISNFKGQREGQPRFIRIGRDDIDLEQVE